MGGRLERPPGEIKNLGDSEPSAFELIHVADDQNPIPPRRWLLGNSFCRQFVSGLIGRGSGGKTSLRIVQAISVASGRHLTGEYVFSRCPVLIACLEDGRDELRRRVRAALVHHQITADEISDHLFIVAPTGLKLALTLDGTRRVAPGELERHIRETVSKHRIGLVILDPFIKLHDGDENDNVSVDGVSTILSRLAIELDIAVDVLSHERKASNAVPGDMDRSRGASSSRDANRLLYTTTGMSKEEREAFGLTLAEQAALIRLDSAKVNIVPPSTEARWFKIVGVRLGNGDSQYPEGDEVPTVEAWTPPDAWRYLTNANANLILDDIDQGIDGSKRYTATPQARKRAAWKVVQEHLPDLTEIQCRRVISAWLRDGTLKEITVHDGDKGRDEAGLSVEPSKRPS